MERSWRCKSNRETDDDRLGCERRASPSARLVPQFGQVLQELTGVHEVSAAIRDTTGTAFTRFARRVVHQILVLDVVPASDHEHHCL